VEIAEGKRMSEFKLITGGGGGGDNAGSLLTS
jgi:hypothetical protein